MNSSSALIASDLDRTLIYSRRFLAETSEAVCVEVYDGAPISYMTPGAVARLSGLASTHVVVPATTRTVAQFQRVRLPGEPYRFAVTSNGGTILCDGEPDEAWRATIEGRIAASSAPIVEVVGELRARVSDSWVRSLRVAEDLFCYVVVDEARLPERFLDEWREWCSPRGWVVSRQGRKIYAVPLTLCKSHAVAEVRRRLVRAGELTAATPLLAAGDGALDTGLLVYADEAIRPAHGELHGLGWSTPGLTVTAASGASAAEEILQWFGAPIEMRCPERVSACPSIQASARHREDLR